jgi:GNAT superfamily N-acetyltransferase
MNSPLFKKKGMDALLEMFNDPDYATHQHHAEPPNYRKPWGEKGTEPESNRIPPVIIPPKDIRASAPADTATCKHCGRQIKKIRDPWGYDNYRGHEYGWYHPELSDEKYESWCGDEYGEYAEPADAAPTVTASVDAMPVKVVNDPNLPKSPEGVQDATFFKESDPDENLHDVLNKHGYKFVGRVSDGTLMWALGKDQRVVVNPKAQTWQHQTNGAVDDSGPLNTLSQQLSSRSKTAALETEKSVDDIVAGLRYWDDIHDSYRGENFGAVYATYGEASPEAPCVGKLNFSVVGDEISIKYLSVRPNFRRKGIATKLYEKLKEAYPGKKIDHGMTTEDGTAWLNSVRQGAEKQAMNAPQLSPDMLDRMYRVQLEGLAQGDCEGTGREDCDCETCEAREELERLTGKQAAGKPKCPHCGSTDYGLMPSDFETAKCNDCGKNWDHGIVPGINDPKEASAKVAEKGAELTVLGTKMSGFAGGGPFSCMDCIHRTPHSKNAAGEMVDSCKHPTVMADPELADRKLPDGTIEVDNDDCCTFVRPTGVDKQAAVREFHEKLKEALGQDKTASCHHQKTTCRKCGNVQTCRCSAPKVSSFVETCSNCDGSDPFAKSAAKKLYHVTQTEKVPAIQAKGILPLQPSNWVKGESDERYGEGEIFAFNNPIDAVRWAGKMDWDFNKSMGTGKISVVSFTPGKEKWVQDTADPMGQAGAQGKWLKAVGAIKPEQIVGVTPVTSDLIKAVVAGQSVKLADIVEKSYGMGTPIGGTANPGGASDDPEADAAANDLMEGNGPVTGVQSSQKEAKIDPLHSPSYKPPRDDSRGHLDESLKKEIMEGVYDDIPQDSGPKKTVNAAALEGEILPKRRGNWKLYAFEPDGKTEIGRWYVGDKGKAIPIINENWGPITQHQINEIDRVGYLNLGDVIIKVTNFEFPKPAPKPDENGHTLDVMASGEDDLYLDMQDEHFLDQVSDVKRQAREAFMQDGEMIQVARENGYDMNQLWKEVGEEYTNDWFEGQQHFGSKEAADAPKCPMCKSAKAIAADSDKAKSNDLGPILAECLDCGVFYTL